MPDAFRQISVADERSSIRENYGHADPLKRLLHEHLVFEFLDADRRFWQGPFTTGPRLLPHFVCACFEGPWRLRIGQEESRTMENGGCLVGAQAPHEIYASTGERFTSTWIHGRFLLFGTIELTAGRTLVAGSDGDLFGRLSKICLEMSRLMSISEVPPLAAAAQAQRLGYELLERLVEPLDLGANLAERLLSGQRLTPALDYIARHLAEPFRRDDLAEMVHLSATRFHTLFLSTVGTTPLAYANQQRMLAARTLLVSTDLPVSVIARQTCPFDIFHFSRVFSHAYGLCPREYRKRHQLQPYHTSF